MYKDIKRISHKKLSAKSELPVYVKDKDGSLEFIENIKFRFILSEDKIKNIIRLCRESKHLHWVNRTYGVKLNTIYFYNEYSKIEDTTALLPTQIHIRKSDELMIKVREIRFKNLF